MNVPFDDIVRFGQKSMLENPLFSISWILGRFCNYKCSYCWPYARSDRVDHLSFDVYKNTVDQIKLQANDNGFNEFHWSFSGGEPTAYKELLNLLEYVPQANEYHSVHMTTNLSPGNNFWKSWIDRTSAFKRRSITASFHAEFADEKEFADKLLMLIENNVFVTINQVMVPAQFYELYEKCKWFNDQGINVTLKPQSNLNASKVVDGYDSDMITLMQTGFPQKFNGEEIHQISLYDKENNEYLFDQAERFNAFDFNKFKGWLCNSGYQSIIIRGDEVKRSYSCHDHPLGSLTKGFQIFSNPRICITPSCVSSADSKIPKCIDTKI